MRMNGDIDNNSDVWEIEDGVLENCFIEESEIITIPQSVRVISTCACDCYQVKTIYIPKNVQVIEDGAFMGCYNLKEIIIENPDIILESGCFFDLENLERVQIFGQEIQVVVTKGEYSTKDEIGNCLERYLGKDETYQIDDDIKKINETAFVNCNALKEVIIPDSVVEIDNRAFEYCNHLTKVKMPEFLEIIGENAFNYCYNVNMLKIPNTVFNIREGAFNGWTKNQTIYVPQYFKGTGIKLFQKWRKGCKAKIIYY